MTSRPANKADGTANGSEPVTASGQRRFLSYATGFAWVINVCLLLIAFGWIYCCGQSRGIVELMKYQSGAVDPTAGIVVRDPSRLSSGVAIGIVHVMEMTTRSHPFLLFLRTPNPGKPRCHHIVEISDNPVADSDTFR